MKQFPNWKLTKRNRRNGGRQWILNEKKRERRKVNGGMEKKSAVRVRTTDRKEKRNEASKERKEHTKQWKEKKKKEVDENKQTPLC